MTSERRLRRLAITLLAMALAPLTVLATASPSAADDTAILGAVLDAEGDPAIDVPVDLYRWNEGAEEWEESASTDTDPAGEYEFHGLSAGDYLLNFADGSADYLAEWWDDQASFGDADPISIAGNDQTTLHDVVLATAGHLTGTVTNSSADPIQGIQVRAYLLTDSGWSARSTGDTDAAGEYDFGGLAAGTYTLRFGSIADPGYLIEFWNDKASLEAAESIQLDAAETVVADAELVEGGQISGTVTGAGVGPLADIDVDTYVWNDDDGEWESVFEEAVQTGADGSYQVRGLRAGVYTVGFSDRTGTYRGEFWDDEPDIYDADGIEVELATTYSGTNAELALDTSVGGAVVDAEGNPAVGIPVELYRWNAAAEYWSFQGGMDADSLGEYDFHGLSPGTYSLEFASGSDDYLTEWWDDQSRSSLATEIALTAGDHLALHDTELAAAGHITGTVTNAAHQPLQGIRVSAYALRGSTWVLERTETTGPTGDYDIGGLAGGFYVLRFRDPAPTIYLEEFWDNQAVIEAADPISLDPAGTEDADAVLGLGGSIAGTVSADTGGGLEGVYVIAFQREDDHFEEAGFTETLADGSYTIPGLSTGTYRLQFYPAGTGYLYEFWNNQPTPEDATDISVTTGATTSGTNAVLTSGGHITGTVRDASDAVLSGVAVSAYRWEDGDWAYVNGAYTGPDGTYDINGLPTGTYTLEFFDDSGAAHANEYWDDAATIDDADMFNVTATETTSGKDATLGVGGHITGTVTDSHGDPLEDAAVGVFQWKGGEWTSLNTFWTDSAGEYDVYGLAAGSYRLRFAHDGNGDLAEYFANSATLADAATIIVGAGLTVPSVNAQLAASGHITGTVTGTGGVELDGILVVAYVERDGDWTAVRSDVTQDGEYDIGGLATGTYRLHLEDLCGCTYLSEFHSNSESIDTAQDVAVVAGASTDGIDEELAEGSRITGTVTGPDGAGVADVDVDVLEDDGEGGWDYVGYASTDDDGSYEVGGLPPGSYRLEFTDYSGNDFDTEFWNDVADVELAADIDVPASTTVTGKDAELSATIDNLSLPRITGSPLVGSTLTASPGFWARSPGLSFDYQWLANGVPIGSADDATYIPVAADLGKTLNVRVTASKAGLRNGTAQSVATGVVLPVPTSAITNVVPPSIGGAPGVGATLTAAPGTWSPNSGLTFGYQWLADGAPIGEATSATYIPVGSDVGKTVQVRVTASRDGYTSGTATSAGVTVPAEPTIANVAPPSVGGVPKVGVAVSASPGTWDPADSVITYQWLVDGIAVGSGRRYTPVPADVGKALRVMVTATKTGHTEGSATSAGKTVRPGTITATTDPSVDGKAKRGATLVLDIGSWTPVGAKVTGHWYAGPDRIERASSTSLTLTGRIARVATGKRISVQVTVAAPGYRTEVVTIRVPGRVKRE